MENPAVNPRFKKLLSLSVRERLAIAEALLKSLEGEVAVPPLTPSQRRELDRRWRKHLRSPSAAIPLEDVLSEIRTRLAALTSRPKPRRTSTKR